MFGPSLRLQGKPWRTAVCDSCEACGHHDLSAEHPGRSKVDCAATCWSRPADLIPKVQVEKTEPLVPDLFIQLPHRGGRIDTGRSRRGTVAERS